MTDEEIKLAIVRYHMDAGIASISQKRPSPEMQAFIEACEETFKWVKSLG